MKSLLSALVILFITSVGAQSPLDLAGWGAVTDPVSGAARGTAGAGLARTELHGTDLRNPSAGAWQRHTSFQVQFSASGGIVRDDANPSGSGVLATHLPLVCLKFPLGEAGVLGLGSWQRHRRSFVFPVSADHEFALEGGGFELAASFAREVPGLEDLALAVAWHHRLGLERRVESVRLASSDEPAFLNSDTVLVRRRGGQAWLSATWKTHALGVSVSAALPASLKESVELRRSGADAPIIDRRDLDAPTLLAAGISWEAVGSWTILGDFVQESWTRTGIAVADPRRVLSLGVERKAGGDRFDGWWKRTPLRAGTRIDADGPRGSIEAVGTVGAGLPMGQIAVANLAAETGWRTTMGDGPRITESVIRVYVSVAGASRWGSSSRRRR